MDSGPLRTIRFARHWYRPGGDLGRDEIVLDGPSGRFDTTRLRPLGGGHRATWILLHGITRPGRRHVVLNRFARALAGTGATVLVPEIPAWTELDLAPGDARRATLAALESLGAEGAPPGPVGVIGFSFGAPQAIRLGSDPEIGPRLACVAGFGGYGTLERAVTFLWSGRHDWKGEAYSTRPDPYGRWVVGANFLADVPGFENAGDVADALRTLAGTAGDRQIPSWDPMLDDLKDRLEASLPPSRRGLFRRFAPPASADPPGDPDGWADRLSRAGLAARPLLDLPPVVTSLAPVVLIHGRSDALVPFSETLRLAERIRAPELHVTITGLFEHSDEAPERGRGWPGELWRLGGTLSALLGSV